MEQRNSGVGDYILPPTTQYGKLVHPGYVDMGVGPPTPCKSYVNFGYIRGQMMTVYVNATCDDCSLLISYFKLKRSRNYVVLMFVMDRM